MGRRSFSDRLVAAKPNVVLMPGFAFIIGIGILGDAFSWKFLFHGPAAIIAGGVLFLFGFLLHVYCHRFHAKAHEKSKAIRTVVDTGPFAVIRHPMYLGLIAMYIGLVVAWGIVWMLIPAVFYTALIISVSIKEEKYLLQTLGAQYQEYMHKVPWRYIPGVF